MAFLLGSFTSGLFGGASDVMTLANNYEKYKQNKILTQQAQDMMNAGKLVGQGMKGLSTALPGVQAGPINSTSAGPIKNPSSDIGDGGKDNNPFDDPVLNAMPPVGNSSNFEAGGALSMPNMAAGGSPSPLQTPQAGTGASTAIPEPAIGKVPGPRKAAPHYLPVNPRMAPVISSEPNGAALPGTLPYQPPTAAPTALPQVPDMTLQPPTPHPGAAPTLGNSMNPMGALMTPYTAGYGRGI